ncbi:MAG: cyclopropane-fatty-acyl-phospholipid synthase [Frankiaceae bacterium]|jgi:cyclopropane-fatty-acyl-phospholipid synthase|nr:cyclopropane-fatty-acyl-phospholipid synthase [Frankiaceae bacterium]
MPVADELLDLVRDLTGADAPLRVRAWDGSEAGPEGAPTVVVRSPDALRRLLWAPNELGLGRAFVAGDIDVEDDLYAVLAATPLAADTVAPPDRARNLRTALRAVRTAARVGAFGRPLPPPPEEARLRGRLHTKSRDAAAIAHHYDVGNDFYRLVLGPSLVYSCAYFPRPDATLEEAQAAKLDLVCRKLALEPGMRLLDVGCGWGSLVLHAAREYGVRAVGVTISEEQAALARRRVADAALSDRVEIRVQDYRDVTDGPFDAVSSIGMAEHVGRANLTTYAGRLYSLLRPGGRLLNHMISRRPGPQPSPRTSFLWHYVFPDGDLQPIGLQVGAVEEAGFEVRDVEALREHYALTLRHWVANLEGEWDRAVALAGEGRARVWRLYMAGAALGFEAGRIGVNQTLAVRQDDGRSGFPLTRGWLAARRPVDLRDPVRT